MKQKIRNFINFVFGGSSKSLSGIRFSGLTSIFLAAIILASCGSKEVSSDNPEARKLFSLSAETIETFIQKTSVSKDSLEIDSLDKVYEKKMTEINFSVPPSTDYQLTEQENDSLYKLQLHLLEIRENKLKEFSFKSLGNEEAADSIISERAAFDRSN
ncbi:MAG: hypothetical protein J1D77_02115 [Muribaculaceae bacterium]|nr:hypothetical protein [Muribaculaceae bacterium]